MGVYFPDLVLGPLLSNEEERKKLFYDLKAELYKRQLSNAENFDKSVLTYSSAGLGFSLAFLKDFLPIASAKWGWLLYGSWALFTLAIVITIISYITSQCGINTQLSIAERYYLRQEEKAINEKNFFASLTDLLNSASGCFFVAAIIFTTAFVSINLERVSTMSKQKIQNGMPVPVMQRIQQSDTERGAPVPHIQQVPQQQSSQQSSTTQQPSPKKN